MDYIAIVSGLVIAGASFMLGRIWSLREYLQLRAAYDRLVEAHAKLTDRDEKGRFIKRDKGSAL